MKCILAVLLLVLVDKINESNGLCNSCSGVTGLACVSQTSFKICENGSLNQNTTEVHCPNGTFCTPDARVCAASATGLPSACAQCGQCLDGSTFACISYNQFAFCLEGGIADASINYTCPADLVCNSGLTPICSDPSITGIGSQCPWEEITTTASPVTEASTPSTVPTTPDPLSETNLFCVSKGKPGRYEVSKDATCQLFVSCISTNGIMLGNLYECPQSKYFNETTQRCGVDKPARCA